MDGPRPVFPHANRGGATLTAVMRRLDRGYCPEMPDDFGPPRDDAAEHASAPIVPDPRASGAERAAEKPSFLVWAGLSLVATVVLSLLFDAAGSDATAIVFLLFLVGMPVLIVKLRRNGARAGRDEADRRHGR
jgi:hypothetical protein